MSWILFALLAPFFYSSSNILDKIVRDKFIKDTIALVMLGNIFSALVFLCIFLFHGLAWFGWYNFILALSVALIYQFSLFPYYKGLLKGEVSKVVPLYNLVPLFVLFLSFIFLKETLLLKHYFAFFLILLGSFILNFDNSKSILRFNEAFWWTVLTTFIWAVVVIILKFLYISGDFWTQTGYISAGSIFSFLGLFSIKKFRLRFIKTVNKLNIQKLLYKYSSSFITLLADLSSRFALTSGAASLVSVIGGFQALFALLLAFVLSYLFPHLLKEEISKKIIFRRFIAVSIMIFGLYFVY